VRRDVPIVLGLLAAAVICVDAAKAQISDDVVRIGVLNDQSNVYADLGGPGSVIAARMAIEDVGGKVLGKPINLLVADHQSKADIGASIARQWFDADKVDMVIGFDNSSVALAVEQVAFQLNRVAIAGAIGTTAFTGKSCTPNEAAWVYDAYALTNTLARSVVRRGQDTWFFITVDYSLGYSLEADATSAVVAGGGKVLGSVRHPLNTADFSSYLLQAQASGAKVVALANAGGDMTNAIKQANEFGLTRAGQTVVSLLTFITDVNSVGLKAAQGLTFVTAFYWDRDDESRAWSKRFFALHSACRPWRKPRSIPPSDTICTRSMRPVRTRQRRSWPRCVRFPSTIFMPRTAEYVKTAEWFMTCISFRSRRRRNRPAPGTITRSCRRSRAIKRFVPWTRAGVRWSNSDKPSRR